MPTVCLASLRTGTFVMGSGKTRSLDNSEDSDDLRRPLEEFGNANAFGGTGGRGAVIAIVWYVYDKSSM